MPPQNQRPCPGELRPRRFPSGGEGAASAATAATHLTAGSSGTFTASSGLSQSLRFSGRPEGRRWAGEAARPRPQGAGPRRGGTAPPAARPRQRSGQEVPDRGGSSGCHERYAAPRGTGQDAPPAPATPPRPPPGSPRFRAPPGGAARALKGPRPAPSGHRLCPGGAICREPLAQVAGTGAEVKP